MTVEELIEHLKSVPSHAEVRLSVITKYDREGDWYTSGGAKTVSYYDGMNAVYIKE